MDIERISKPYFNSGNHDALAVIIPKVIRETLEITEETYVRWHMTLTENGVEVTVEKV